MASLPPEERRKIADAAMAKAWPLMQEGRDILADPILRHAVHEGAWAPDMIRAGIELAQADE